MIIVEGPDGSGKTTLLKQLAAEFPDIPIAPRVVSKDAEAMVDLKQWTEENVAKGWQDTFYDRHRLISEPIYGAVLRDSPEPGFDDFSWMFVSLLTFYTACSPIVIYCLPPLEVVLSNLEGDADNEVINPKASVIYAAYVAALSRDYLFRPTRTLIYDYTGNTWRRHEYEDIVNLIKDILGRSIRVR
jgi:hypothetical protein